MLTIIELPTLLLERTRQKYSEERKSASGWCSVAPFGGVSLVTAAPATAPRMRYRMLQKPLLT